MTKKTSCHCGASKPYAQCCEQLHSGQKTAKTAAQLMRSRYSAFAVENADYLLATQHASTRPQRSEITSGMAGCEWLGLKITGTKAGKAGDQFGEVSFVASYKEYEKPGEIKERSQFVFENGHWFYLTGVSI